MKNENFTNSNVKFLREQKEISQFKMSLDLNINQTTIAKWESNSRQITLDWAIKLANYFNLSVGDFISKDLKEINNKTQKNKKGNKNEK